MSLSLIGIIFVQAYYISNSFKNEEQQFAFNVRKAISYVSSQVEKDESRDFLFKLQGLIKEGKNVDTTAIIQFYLKESGGDSNKTLLYSNDILEENYKFSSRLFDIAGLDSINVKRILNERETKFIENQNLDGNKNLNAMLSQIGTITEVDKILWETTYKDNVVRTPIHKRISKEKIDHLLQLKLRQDDIDIDFEFAIYSNGLATKVKTEDFEIIPKNTWNIPIFYNKKDKNNYKLFVNFPEKKSYILSSIIRMLVLSIVFTLIIILAYGSALFQLTKQRQISQIKTDFINNMTHEFKTPIATINLALDAIRNPKIINDKEKVTRYLTMIKEENKRMHAQVENVLRISKLEKNELNISKDRVEVNDLVEDAVSHIELIVEDRQGAIEINLTPIKLSVLANETHFINVLVNILDNAVKYSPNAPKISIKTERIGNNCLIKIKDHGSGMSKIAQKRVFEKFYREHTGNIHNVKGHGLGLAYVKQIIDDHHGQISVESEKEKGSEFTIKLPLIS